MNDTATWYIDTLSGGKKYSVDTDF